MGRLIRLSKAAYTSGELDPLLHARTDIKHYVNGAEKMRNVFGLPQGGFKRRPGLEYIEQLPRVVVREAAPTISVPNGGTAANANDADETTELQTTTGVSTTNPYVVVQYDLGSAKDVMFVDVIGLRLDSGSLADEFVIQYSTDAAAWTTLGADIDLTTTDLTARRRGSVTARYLRLARIGSTDLGASVVILDEFHVYIQQATLSAFREIDFEFSIDTSYLLVVSDQNVAVYKNGVWQVDLPSKHTTTHLPNLTWAQSSDTLLLFHEDVQTQKYLRNTDIAWDVADTVFTYIPKYDYVPATSNPATTLTPDGTEGQVKLTAGVATFSSADVDQKISGNGGLARIVQYNSTTEVVAVVEIPFYNTDAIASGDWTLRSGYEDAWSDARGWPACGHFFQGRLIVGGGPLANRMWGSRIAEFFDFEMDQGLDNEPIEGAIDDDEYHEIVGFHSGKKLQIFTSSAVFTVPTTPITPATFSFERAVRVGAKKGIPVVEIENATIFLHRRGSTIHELIFDDLVQDYKSPPLSLLSSHLILDPSSFAKRNATSTEEADMLLAVGTDGSLATCAVVRAQEVVSWQKQTTEGNFIDVAVDGETIYCVVERTIDGDTQRHLERFSDDHFFDASEIFTSGLPTDTFVASHLPSTLVTIYADDFYMGTATTDATGSTTLVRDADTDCEIGLAFPMMTDDDGAEKYTPYVRSMSIEPELPEGLPTGKKKRIVNATANLYETTSLLINGERVIFRQFGESGSGTPLDTPVSPFTGLKKIDSILGFEDQIKLEFMQDIPGKLTVRGTTVRVSV